MNIYPFTSNILNELLNKHLSVIKIFRYLLINFVEKKCSEQIPAENCVQST
jgi:hypothetical protein